MGVVVLYLLLFSACFGQDTDGKDDYLSLSLPLYYMALSTCTSLFLVLTPSRNNWIILSLYLSLTYLFPSLSVVFTDLSQNFFQSLHSYLWYDPSHAPSISTGSFFSLNLPFYHIIFYTFSPSVFVHFFFSLFLSPSFCLTQYSFPSHTSPRLAVVYRVKTPCLSRLQQAYQGDKGPPGVEAQWDLLLVGCIYIPRHTHTWGRISSGGRAGEAFTFWNSVIAHNW